MSFARAPLDELWEGEKVGVRVGGHPVLLYRCDGVIRAFADRCAHQRMPVSPGRLHAHVLACPVHGWTYDLRTGRGVNPRTAALARYAVEERADGIWVDVPEQEAP